MKRKPQTGELSLERAEVLLSGKDMFHIYRGAKRMGEDWKTWRVELMRRWVTKHEPGTRPWGFWRFEHPELFRLQLGGSGKAAYLVENAPAWTLENYFGRTRGTLSETCAEIPKPEYESDAACLARAGLLTAEEMNQLNMQ